MISCLSWQYSDLHLSPTAPALPLPSVSLIGVLSAYQYMHLTYLNLPAILAFSLPSALLPTDPLPLSGSITPPSYLGPDRPSTDVCYLLTMSYKQLWLPLIIATRAFLFRVDRFSRSPHLATHVIQLTFLFWSQSLLPHLVVVFSQLLCPVIVRFPCFLSSPFP